MLDIPNAGFMLTPRIGNKMPESYLWAADNGCFSAGDKFDLAKFLVWLEEHDNQEKCLFATAPDVLTDAKATLKRSLPVLGQIRDLGYAAAFVGQDGATVDDIPWDDMDCLFIGGSTDWKLSDAVRLLVDESKARGKWAHMGRVNSWKRIKLAANWGCDSVDGTLLCFGMDTHLPSLRKWLERLNGESVY
ncbi:MAG TPA: hypothetical protein VH593_21090 [Ktedonobacteraceae bacterium]